MSEIPPATIEGEVAPGFEAVRDAFAANFSEHGDVGAAVCIYHQGRKVVDLTGGWSSVTQQVPYGPDTLQLVFSTTKGATALCAHILVERGELDLDAPVASYWPEFAAEGKSDIPVRFLLNHQAGLPTIDATLSLEEVAAWNPIVDALAAQKPFWEPGTAHGYHALTYGWLVGEVVRRISGKFLGQFFADEVASPLGLEFWIGLPEAYEERVSKLRMAPFPPFQTGADGGEVDPKLAEMAAAFLDPAGLALRALTLNGSLATMVGGSGTFNSRTVHAAELPAANAITNATSLARMYAAIVGEVDGIRLVSPATVERATTVESEGPDKVLFNPSRFGLGFMIDYKLFSPLLSPASFGHSGAGGSLGFADKEAGIGFGYVMNQMRMALAADVRPAALIDALRTCL